MRAWAPAAVPARVEEPAAPVVPAHPWWRPDPLLLLVLAPLLYVIWRPGAPVADDLWGHLARAEYLADRLRADGLRALLSSAWMNQWFLGDPYRTYQPPLAVHVLAPLTWMLGDSLLAARVVQTMVVAGLAFFGYLSSSRSDHVGRPAALLVAALLAWSPVTISVLFVEGDLGRAIGLLALPALAVLTELKLEAPRGRWSLVVLPALLWAVALLAHPAQALAFAACLMVYAVARMVSSHLRPSGVAWTALAMVAGAGLAAPWLLPAWLGGEVPGVPHVPDRLYDPRYVATLRALLPDPGRAPGLPTLGGGAVALAVVAAVARPDPRRGAWLFTAIVAFWLALGSGFLALVPYGRTLAPSLFLPFAAVALAKATGGLLPLALRSRLGAAAVLGAVLLLLDASGSLAIARRRLDPSMVRAAAADVAAQPGAGRVVLFALPESGAVDIHALTRRSGHDLVQGWGLDLTPQHLALRRLPAAASWGPGYVRRLLDLWDVRIAVVTSTQAEEAAQAARAALSGAGFARHAVHGPYEILVRAAPTSRIRALPERPMLVVGRGVQPFLRAFPFAAEATHPTVRGNRLQLAGHAAVAAFRFEDDAAALREAEAELRRYVEAGGRLVVDLSGMERLVGGDGFLGVRVRGVELDRIDVQWSGPLSGLPGHLTVPAAPGERSDTWRGAVYEGLETVTAEVEAAGARHAVAGSRALGVGRVEFVGLNLLYRDLLAGEGEVTRRLAGAAIKDAYVSEALEWPAVPVSFQRVGDGRQEYTYEAERGTNAVVSTTWSPRWRAFVDGRAVGLLPYERLMRVFLPEGRHHLTLVYQPFGTRWPVAGLVAGVATAAFLLVLVLSEREGDKVVKP